MDFHGPMGEDEVIKVNMELAQKRNFTADDLENLPEDVRAELIDGQIFYFASPKTEHQTLVVNLCSELRYYIKHHCGRCRVFVAPWDVKLDCDDSTVMQPDIAVVCDEGKIHEDGCYGAPDLVIEITSRSTRKRDYGIKMRKYRQAGVKEYWIVDLEKRVVLVYWFENEDVNCLYSFDEEISFHLFPEIKVQMNELLISL